MLVETRIQVFVWSNFSNSAFCLPLQIEDIITRIQDETEGVPIRTVKSFMTKIPSVVTGKKWEEKETDVKCKQWHNLHQSISGGQWVPNEQRAGKDNADVPMSSAFRKSEDDSLVTSTFILHSTSFWEVYENNYTSVNTFLPRLYRLGEVNLLMSCSVFILT